MFGALLGAHRVSARCNPQSFPTRRSSHLSASPTRQEQVTYQVPYSELSPGRLFITRPTPILTTPILMRDLHPFTKLNPPQNIPRSIRRAPLYCETLGQLCV